LNRSYIRSKWTSICRWMAEKL